LLIYGVPEPDILQRLASLSAEMSDQMSADQLRLFNEMMTKKWELKLAEEAFMAEVSQEADEDEHVAESLRAMRKIFEDPSYRLSGTETVVLASYYKQLEGNEESDTKRLNVLLHSHKRKPANTTKIVDTLAKKKLMETRSDGMHSHKTFFLTAAGQQQAIDLLQRLSIAPGRERLSVVD